MKQPQNDCTGFLSIDKEEALKNNFEDVKNMIRPTNVTEQPAPVTTELSEEICDQVIEDLKFRKKLGFEKYGTPLKSFNGRNALRDAYEEALDLVQYLKQQMVEDKRTYATYDELEQATDLCIQDLQKKNAILSTALAMIIGKDPISEQAKIAEEALELVHDDWCELHNIKYSECEC